jgi:hypothetical protein
MSEYVSVWREDMEDRGKENWKDIEGFERKYQVSDLGRVRSLEFRNNIMVKKRTKLLRLAYDIKGYQRVALGAGKKRYKVHALVCEAFCGKQEDGQECCHLNGNPEDNRACNLIWATRKENHAHKKIHGTQPMGNQVLTAKLTETKVRGIKHLLKLGHTVNTLAKVYGVSLSCINGIKQGRSWGYV